MFQFLRGVAVIAAMMLNCGAAFADPDTQSANFYLSACRDFTVQSKISSDSFTRGLCVGNIDALMTVGAPLGICPPPTATLKQAILVVVQYIDQRPARMHEVFAALAMEALEAAWPCKN
jgi:hypothetical protein